MKAFRVLTSKTVALPTPDIDTDQIIAAQFLKVTDKKGLGEKLFHGWRYLPDGRMNPDFVLNTEMALGAEILVAGDNFGCGSSREHAPWALLDYGFRAVVSTSIADIFKNNSLKNGLLPIVVNDQFHTKMMARAGHDATIDLEQQTITLSDGTKTSFETEPFARYCLLKGLNQLDYLLEQTPSIDTYEETTA